MTQLHRRDNLDLRSDFLNLAPPRPRVFLDLSEYENLLERRGLLSSHFSGREDELDELERLLSVESRAVILEADGGIGKTRLAYELSFTGSLPLFVSLVYLLFRRALAVAALRVRSREFKELEIVSSLLRPAGFSGERVGSRCSSARTRCWVGIANLFGGGARRRDGLPRTMTTLGYFFRAVV